MSSHITPNYLNDKTEFNISGNAKSLNIVALSLRKGQARSLWNDSLFTQQPDDCKCTTSMMNVLLEWPIHSPAMPFIYKDYPRAIFRQDLV
jgi:hypothetical protein